MKKQFNEQLKPGDKIMTRRYLHVVTGHFAIGCRRRLSVSHSYPIFFFLAWASRKTPTID